MSYLHSNEKTLGEVIKTLIENYHIQDKLKEIRLIDAWEQIAGKMIAKHTLNLGIKKRVFYIEVDSAALRNELNYSREKIKTKLNKKAGEKLIDEVVIR